MTRAPLRIFAAGAAHPDPRARPNADPADVSMPIGGAAFNAALAMRRFGAEVDLLSARGGDGAGERVAEALEAGGIRDLSFTWLDRATATETAILDRPGDPVAGVSGLTIYDCLAHRSLRQRRIRERMATSDALLLDAHLPEETIARLLRRFAGRPTAAIAVSPSKALRLRAELPNLSALFLSRREAAVLAEWPETSAPEALAARLAELGVRRAVVTNGDRDVVILDEGTVFFQSFPAASSSGEATGACNALAGFAFAAYVEGASLAEAVRLGIAAGTGLTPV